MTYLSSSSNGVRLYRPGGDVWWSVSCLGAKVALLTFNKFASKISVAHQYTQGAHMQHQTQYWLTCPECGHQMEVGYQGGPLRAKYCEKCDLLFSFTNEELAVAESVGMSDPVGYLAFLGPV
jgi:hypothetical protein